ncbi:zf-HC2 domain-containing protein [Micromonospora sp. WMMC241]|uniref:zf-HC2 domain-containing protein n=1 Tax=Micromonospora sp. WMMC241 TaxID=3015159 RepID=UPI0022B60964|nr:zf-HC2 domain-containing protein [Micromonospora sp. WMMC241]MCZ7436864.1 zf-HC2 domain-containing protein [Micromonospora sp. WMMC241]
MRTGGENPTSEHEALALYLLGALDDADRVAFEAHLAGCDECLAAAADLGGAASGLDTLDAGDWAEFDLPPAAVLPPRSAPAAVPPPRSAPPAASGSVTPTAASGSVTPTAASGSVTPTAASGSVTPTAASGSVTPTAASGSVTPTAASGSVTPTAASGSVTPTAASGSVTPTAASGSVTPTAAEPVAPAVGASSASVPGSLPDPGDASAPDGAPVTAGRRLVRPGRGPGGTTAPASAPGGVRPGGGRSRAPSPRRRLLLWAGAVALAVAVLTGGIVATAGGGGGRDDLVLTATGEAPGQGVGLSVSITTHEGQGSTIRITATGLRPGLRYRLFAVTRDGVTHPVRDWTASTGPQEVTGELSPPVDQLSFVGVGLPDGTSVVTAPISR